MVYRASRRLCAARTEVPDDKRKHRRIARDRKRGRGIRVGLPPGTSVSQRRQSRPSSAKRGITRQWEALGLPVPAVWWYSRSAVAGVIVFDRVSGASFAEQMQKNPSIVP